MSPARALGLAATWAALALLERALTSRAREAEVAELEALYAHDTEGCGCR